MPCYLARSSAFALCAVGDGCGNGCPVAGLVLAAFRTSATAFNGWFIVWDWQKNNELDVTSSVESNLRCSGGACVSVVTGASGAGAGSGTGTGTGTGTGDMMMMMMLRRWRRKKKIWATFYYERESKNSAEFNGFSACFHAREMPVSDLSE